MTPPDHWWQATVSGDDACDIPADSPGPHALSHLHDAKCNAQTIHRDGPQSPIALTADGHGPKENIPIGWRLSLVLQCLILIHVFFTS